MYPSRAGDNIWHYWIIPPLISQGNHSRWEQQEAMKNVVYLQKAKLGPFIMYIFLRCRWPTKFPSPNMVWESPRSQNGTWCWPQMERKKGYGQLSANIRCPDAVERVGQLDASDDTKQSGVFIYEHNTKQIVNVHPWSKKFIIIAIWTETKTLLTSRTCQRWRDRKTQTRWARLASNTLRNDSSQSGPEKREQNRYVQVDRSANKTKKKTHKKWTGARYNTMRCSPQKMIQKESNME